MESAWHAWLNAFATTYWRISSRSSSRTAYVLLGLTSELNIRILRAHVQTYIDWQDVSMANLSWGRSTQLL